MLPIYDVIRCFPVIDSEQMDMLLAAVTDEEIRRAVFDMRPFKALGVDSLHARFFKSQYIKVGKTLCSFVKEMFGGSQSMATIK